MVAMFALTQTPLGRMANAVRDNPERAEFVGYDTQHVRFLQLALSAFFAGVAGGLSCINFEIVSAENVSAIRSGGVLLATFIGGVPFFFGPIIGAFLLTALAEHGYRTDYRVFFICEGVTQYLTEGAVRRILAGLRAAAPGSRMVFTYVRRDFIDGTNRYGTRTLYRSVRQRRQLWHFGLAPEEVADFIGEYGWRLVEQAGPEELVHRYVEPTGRNLKASQIEWSAYAEKA